MAADPVLLAEVLDRATRSLGTPSPRSMEVVFDRWSEVVGPAMAARTRPARVDGETLVLACDEPGVGTHMRYLEPQLLRRIAELSGDGRIRRIQLQVEHC